MHDVLIIGGGVVGLSVAWALAERRVNVAVAESGDFGKEASWAGAGILPPGNPRHAHTPESMLRAQSHVLWPALSAALEEATGINNGFTRCGGLELCLKENHAAFEAEAARWRAEGVEVQLLTAQEARGIEPQLCDRIQAAYLLPEMGQVRNPRHLKALVAACIARNVRLLAGCPVHGYHREAERVLAADTAFGRIAARWFVICGGAWSGGLLRPFRSAANVRPIRGQMVLLQKLPNPLRHVINLGRRYVVPRGDGRVLIGSTEEDVGFLKQVTADGVGGLLEFGCRVAPALRQARFEAAWSGLRPQSADGLPYLGPVPGLCNVFAATGHFRAGLQLSPITAQLITQCILQEAPTMGLEPFALDRHSAA